MFAEPSSSDDVDLFSDPSSRRHHALCHGRSVEDVVSVHPDLKTSRAKANKTPFKRPRFSITTEQPPKYVIALENSQAMNNRDHWELISKAVKKFVLYDLPSDVSLGLVLFNKRAHIAKPVEQLRSQDIRHGISLKIKNKFGLTSDNASCVFCGVGKAIEALNGAGSSIGGTVIVVSQGKSTGVAIKEEDDLANLADKHRLQLFSVSIPKQPQDDISLSLERLAHKTGGESFFIPEESYGKESELSTYVALVDAFREIQARTTGDGPYLVRVCCLLEKKVPPFIGHLKTCAVCLHCICCCGRRCSSPFSLSRETGFIVRR